MHPRLISFNDYFFIQDSTGQQIFPKFGKKIYQLIGILIFLNQKNKGGCVYTLNMLGNKNLKNEYIKKINNRYAHSINFIFRNFHRILKLFLLILRKTL